MPGLDASDTACTVIALVMLGLNAAAYGLMGLDKRRAGTGRPRISERTFWMLAMGGAWPGILVGMRRHRHKTRKTAFLVSFWIAAVPGTLVLGVLAAGCLGLVRLS